jgi:hypothetical protein
VAHRGLREAAQRAGRLTKALTITIHPAAAGAEYLSVSDAMRQVLDVVEALERTEASEVSERTVVWRLTNAHTNSPPLTITAEAFSVDPAVSVAFVATRLLDSFSETVNALLDGRAPAWSDPSALAPLKRALARNTNGIGRTTISTGNAQPIDVVPDRAQRAIAAIEHIAADVKVAAIDESRIEYGSLEAEISAITRWHGKPALKVIERLSRTETTCVLNSEIADQLGPEHRWHEAWEGGRFLISGAFHYGNDGALKRIDAYEVEDRPWTNVDLSDLKDIDVLEGRSIREHLDLMRGER